MHYFLHCSATVRLPSECLFQGGKKKPKMDRILAVFLFQSKKDVLARESFLNVVNESPISEIVTLEETGGKKHSTRCFSKFLSWTISISADL